MATNTLVLDANNILMRSIKAAEGRLHLSVDLGGREVNTGPLLLFAGMVSKYVRQEQPDRMVACWDGGRSAHRVGIYPEYKAFRNEPGEEKDLTPFRLAKDFLTLAGIHHIEMESVEADDLVAAYWHRRRGDDRMVIVSGDKDFLQLIDPWTQQIRPLGGGARPEEEWWDAERVRLKMGCDPAHIPAVMALTGDHGDGVPGIPGFGTKTACKFLAKYDWNLDTLLAAREARLDGQEDAVRRNLALVDLRTPIPGIEVPDPPHFEPTEPGSLLYESLLEWLSALRMESVEHRLSSRTLWR